MHEHGIGVPVNKRTAARYQQLAQQRSLEQKH
jgi:TPR repeat protein